MHLWLSQDIINRKNKYIYCLNNPIFFVDFLGNIELLENHKGVAFVIENGNNMHENNELNTAVTRRNKWYFTPNTGKDILNHLITVTKEYANNCIKLLTIAGHGHSSYNEYNGIPGNRIITM